MNRDPLGEAGGINLYGFVQNNPVNYIDPYGLTAYKVIKLSKKLWGKVMPGRSSTHKRPRVKVYSDQKAKNDLKTKIFPDGDVQSKTNLKVPKNAVEKAVDALKDLGLAAIPLIGGFIDPFDAEALGNGELPADWLNNMDPCK
jgi:uncharacterized protein RhaS with RHS repeats